MSSPTSKDTNASTSASTRQCQRHVRSLSYDPTHVSDPPGFVRVKSRLVRVNSLKALYSVWLDMDLDKSGLVAEADVRRVMTAHEAKCLGGIRANIPAGGDGEGLRNSKAEAEAEAEAASFAGAVKAPPSCTHSVHIRAQVAQFFLRCGAKTDISFHDFLRFNYPDASRRDCDHMAIIVNPPPRVTHTTIKTQEEDEVKRMFQLVDKDGSGAINENEFVELVTEELRSEFALIDTDGSGEINLDEFRKWWIKLQNLTCDNHV